MGTKVGNSYYISSGDIERLNRSEEFLKNLYEVLRAEERGLDKQKAFKHNPNLLHINSNITLRANTILDKEIWIKIQRILFHKTGRFWPMDEFLDLLIFNFLYNEEKRTKKMPLKRKFRGKSYLEYKFESRFRKYFKNIKSQN